MSHLTVPHYVGILNYSETIAAKFEKKRYTFNIPPVFNVPDVDIS